MSDDVPQRVILQKDARLFRGSVVLWEIDPRCRIADEVRFTFENPVKVKDDVGEDIGWATIYVDRTLHQIAADVTLNYHSPERLDAFLAYIFVSPNKEADYWVNVTEEETVMDQIELDYLVVSNRPFTRSSGVLIPKED